MNDVASVWLPLPSHNPRIFDHASLPHPDDYV